MNEIERAKEHAGQMYPAAEIRTRSHAGKPVVLAIEDNLIRLVKFEQIRPGEKPNSASR